MDQTTETRTLRDYLRPLTAHRALIVAATLVAAGAALVISLAQTPEYKAESTVGFATEFFPQAQRAPVAGQTIPPATAAGAEFVTRDIVTEAAADELGDEYTADEVRSKLTVTPEPFSFLVRIEATTDDADEAAEIANVVAAEAAVAAKRVTRAYYRRQADATGDEGDARLARSVEPAVVLGQATAPDAPDSPKPLRNTLFAAVIGLLAGIGIAFVRQALDQRLADPRDAQRRLGLPLVGNLRGGEPSLNGGGPSGADLEAFRILRANVDHLAGEGPVRSVAITSPLAEEGKSTVSVGFAYANALAGRKTILLECDFRRPVLAERLGLEPSPGLSEHLLGGTTPSEVLRRVPVEGPSARPLSVIPAGLDAAQPAELIASATFNRFFEQVAETYEMVVVDCPPLLPVGDSLELLPQVDAVLLCVRVGRTTSEQALAAREAMSHLPARPIGLVATGVATQGEGDYYGYYSHESVGAGGA